MQAAGPAKVGRAACIRPQAVRSEAAADRQADSWASIAATGALTALVAAATLLSSSAAQASADLALGKQVRGCMAADVQLYSCTVYVQLYCKCRKLRV